jgi:purine-nucleoside phosphorylase
MHDEIIIKPTRLKSELEIPETGLLLINPDEARYAVKSAQEKGGDKKGLFNSQLVVLNEGKERYFVAGPSVGAPMAVITLEKLIALGAKNIIVYSWCGSLTEHLHAEDVFMPTWGYSEEGTSGHYPIDGKPRASKELSERITLFLKKKELIPKTEAIWTTDAPYRESRQKVTKLGNEGIAGVDMEFTALSTVARFRNVKLAAVMLVSDELWRNKWSPHFNAKTFRRKSRALIDCLIEFCTKTAS